MAELKGKILLLFLFLSFLAFASSRIIDNHPEFLDKIENILHKSESDSKYWEKIGKKVVKENVKKFKNQKVAKNLILFIGDGLGISTTSAARSYLGDVNKNLAYETLPSVGMAKTYCIDGQVADSACTATAYLCGVKGNLYTIGVNGKVPDGVCTFSKKNRTPSIAKWALDAGKAAGLVTTTRVTHASPAGVFGHTSDRNFEHDAAVLDSGCDPKITEDLAEQIIRNDVGSKLKVILGGGRENFRPKTAIDEEGKPGKRLDGVDLIEEWKKSKKGKGKFVWNREELLKINPKNTSHVLGLFEANHLLYNLEVQEQGREHLEPTLAELVEKAIEVLSSEKKGYFLFVEGGRIDHAHHDTLAKRSLDETVEFSKAIQAAMDKVNMKETLIVVSADHSHAFSYSGYPERDADILGTTSELAEDGLSSMFLGYANGKGYYTHVKEEGGRVDPKPLPRPSTFRYPATVPLPSETHGGEDVGVYAGGPWAELFTGIIEQHAIPHLMAYAACIGDGKKACDKMENL
ncbi:membrane-bound alkaline phosphatase-like [Culicoides brevitarsis]|uniref:membrane-bound alkaline phosphatase-like n=1 Tax=Culicoides brevitarsis TaxID=469753 RepID=UPI00307C9131